MRIQGIHVQGLRAVRDAHHLPFDSRYNVVLASSREATDALHALLLALLFPETDLESAEALADPEGELPARAALAVRFDAQALRVVVDLSKPRVALARFDPLERSYRFVTTRLSEMGAALRAAGRPERSVFGALCLLPQAGLPEPAPEPAPDPSAGTEARWLELRAARHRLRGLEREARKLEAALAGRAALDDALEGLPDALERYRSQSEERERGLRELELDRARLLEERSRTRTVPGAQRPVAALGVALALAGALAALLTHPAVLAAIPLGLGAAGMAIGSAWRARRRIGRIDAELGALRVRETSLERRFETEVADVRSLLLELGLESIDELASEAKAHRERRERLAALDTELRAARRAFPDQAGDELAHLDAELRRAERAATQESAAREDPLSRRFEHVAAAGLIAADALDSRVRVIAPLYLRALTHGRVSGFARGLPGFALECKDEPEPLLSGALAPALRDRVALAFELALGECLAQGAGAPLVVSPGAAPDAEEDARAFGRALARLSSARQVVQFARAEDAFAEHATRLHTLA